MAGHYVIKDYRNPDYTDIFTERQLRLDEVRQNEELLKAMRIHYRENPWDFISDWGMTYEPRNVELGRLANIPFILWPRQEDFLRWLMERWLQGDDGVVEKSRDWGLTWLCSGFAVTEWLFRPGFSAGFGSRKKELVDKIGDPDCIFEKIRHFTYNVPDIFLPAGFNRRVHSGYTKLLNPEIDSSITGEAGDDIGRGGRKSIYFVDEAAFIEHQQSVDNALSNTTNCKIDISTYNGSGNPFYRKSMRFDGTRRKFVCDWHDDPRKDAAWYAKQLEEKDEVTVAQEIDRDPHASAENVFIPPKWVQASVDLHDLIKIPPRGLRVGGFDPADVGDAKAMVIRHGYVIVQAKILTDGDITEALPWAFQLADEYRCDVMRYDADGMGAPAMKIWLRGAAAGRMDIVPYYGSGQVMDRDKKYGEIEGERDTTLKTNAETFLNFRAQSATWLRDRFEASYNLRRQIEAGGVALNFDPEKIISISSKCENFFELTAELSRPKRIFSDGSGKIQVESKKAMKARDVESPNLFDGAVMCSATKAPKLNKRRRKSRSRGYRVRDRGIGI